MKIALSESVMLALEMTRRVVKFVFGESAEIVRCDVNADGNDLSKYRLIELDLSLNFTPEINKLAREFGVDRPKVKTKVSIRHCGGSWAWHPDIVWLNGNIVPLSGKERPTGGRQFRFDDFERGHLGNVREYILSVPLPKE